MNKIEAFVDAYFKRAEKRARRRKTPWNLLLIPLTIIGFIVTAGLLAWYFIQFQQSRMPEDVILSSFTRMGGILMFVPLILPSFCIGLLIADLLAWCIPSARRAFEAEAKGHEDSSFKVVIRKLIISTVVVFVVCIPISFTGAMSYFYVTRSGITINPITSFKERHYAWSQIESIFKRCYAERDNLHLNYELTMRDGTVVDLLEETRWKFVKVYERILPFIENQSDIKYSSEITDFGIRRLKKRYSSDKAARLLEIISN